VGNKQSKKVAVVDRPALQTGTLTAHQLLLAASALLNVSGRLFASDVEQFPGGGWRLVSESHLATSDVLLECLKSHGDALKAIVITLPEGIGFTTAHEMVKHQEKSLDLPH
jgi:hypothetical protein